MACRGRCSRCEEIGSSRARVRKEDKMAALIGLIVGALVGGLAFDRAGAAIGGFVGFFIGVFIASRRERHGHRRPDVPVVVAPTVAVPANEDSLPQKMAELERRVGELERALRAGGGALATVDEKGQGFALSSAAPPPEVEPPSPIPSPPPAPPVTTPAGHDAFARAPDGTLPPLSVEPRAAASAAAASAIEP